jgi:DNA polymerase III delta subunit
MLYIFHGTDREAILKKTESLLQDLSKKDNFEVKKFDADQYNENDIRDLAGATSLFGDKTLTILDGILGKDEENLDILPFLAESQNIFVVREGELTKKIQKEFPKETISTEFNAKSAAKPFFNPFSITDAIASRDKRNAWILFEKALLSGQVADEIFWRVVWQIKTLLIAKQTRSATEADLKPFVYSKAQSALRNWKDGELEQLSENLTVGYLRARRGEGEIETLLEKILLKL